MPAPMDNNSETEDESTSTAEVDASCENLLDRVYDAVRDGQSPYELQGGEWRLDHIHEAVGIWYELGAFEKSKEKGLSLAMGFE